MKAKEIIKCMENWAPKNIAEDWDNIGFQVGKDYKKIDRILLSLDLDHRVYKEAIRGDYEMIITHHPFIFSPISNITNETYHGNLIIKLIESDIVVYNSHTNLDKTVDGVNDRLGELFNLEDSYVLENSLESEDFQYGYGRIGYIKKMKALDLIDIVKDVLDVEYVTFFGEEMSLIEKVAVVGGSGAGFIKVAAKENADILITGDIKYHDAQLAEKLGISLIDAGHFHTEKIILPVIKEKLLKLNNKLKIDIYERPSPLYKIL